MVFWNNGFKGEARGNSARPTALPRSGYGPQSQRVPPAWKTKKGSGPSGDGVGGSSDSRELGDVRTQPPPLSPPLRKAGPQGHPRPFPQRFPSYAGSGVQAPAHAQALPATGGRSGGRGGEGQGEERAGEERANGRGAGPGRGGGAEEWGGAEPA